MKRTERHHLKENEVAEWMLHLKDGFTENRSAIIYGAVGVVVILVGLLGYVAWRQNTESNSRGLLATAMSVAEAPVAPPAAPEAGKPPVQPPGTYPTERAKLEAALPKLQAAADAYPASEAGMIARYRAAAALVALGKVGDGIKQYQLVADQGKGVYPVMARLGVADAQVLAGQYDKAITAYKDISTTAAADAPVDGVLMGLARAQTLAGLTADARQTFRRVTEEFPQSPYAAIARRELDALDAQAGSKK